MNSLIPTFFRLFDPLLNAPKIENEQAITAPINLFPNEILGHIFSFLPIESLGFAKRVCKLWNKVIPQLAYPPLGKIPMELTHMIFTYLSPRTKIRSARVSKPWNFTFTTKPFTNLLDRLDQLANICIEKRLLLEKQISYIREEGHTIVIYGKADCMKIARQDPLAVNKLLVALKAREMLSRDAKNIQRHINDTFIPFIPLVKSVIQSHFLRKAEELENPTGAYIYIPSSTSCDSMEVLVYDQGQIHLGKRKLEKLKYDLIEHLKETNALVQPIYFSEKEILEIKESIRQIRVENGSNYEPLVSLPFYHPHLNQESAIEILTGCPPKTFLMRPSSKTEFDVEISYVTLGGNINHAGITLLKTPNNTIQFFCDENGMIFEDLSSLFHYMDPNWRSFLQYNTSNQITLETTKTFKDNWIWVYSLNSYLSLYNKDVEKRIKELRKLTDKDYIFLYFEDSTNTLMMGRQTDTDLVVTPQDLHSLEFNFKHHHSLSKQTPNCSFQLFDRNSLYKPLPSRFKRTKLSQNSKSACKRLF